MAQSSEPLNRNGTIIEYIDNRNRLVSSKQFYSELLDNLNEMKTIIQSSNRKLNGMEMKTLKTLDNRISSVKHRMENHNGK